MEDEEKEKDNRDDEYFGCLLEILKAVIINVITALIIKAINS